MGCYWLLLIVILFVRSLESNFRVHCFLIMCLLTWTLHEIAAIEHVPENTSHLVGPANFPLVFILTEHEFAQ